MQVSDIYISRDGYATVDLQAYSASYEKRIANLEDENRKLRSMCKEAASEIAEVWEAHCDHMGYGPTNLMARLEGKLPPDFYPAFDDA